MSATYANMSDAELNQLIEEDRYHDWFSRRVYVIRKPRGGQFRGFLTEYIDHPAVLKSVAMRVADNEDHGVTAPGSLTVYYRNGEQVCFDCYAGTVFCSQFGITVSEDGERIYVISDVKGLWCYGKQGNVIWKTRYTSAGMVYPHPDGTLTCVTCSHLILLDANGKPIKKRALFDGCRFELSETAIGIQTSENVAAVIDLQTLEPIIKFSLTKLKIDNLRDILAADDYYILQGRERIGIFDLPNGRREIRDRQVLHLLDKNGTPLRRIEDPAWTWASRAALDRETNEIILRALYKHHTSDTYRIPLP